VVELEDLIAHKKAIHERPGVIHPLRSTPPGNER
jgi:hypothetical protein